MSAKTTKLGLKYRKSKRKPGWWHCKESFVYLSPRYMRWVRIPPGQERDGATWAIDIVSSAWWIHDQLCDDACWEDGSPVTAWQAAAVLGDVLKIEGFTFRAVYWRWTTFAFGCVKTRENGWFTASRRK